MELYESVLSPLITINGMNIINANKQITRGKGVRDSSTCDLSILPPEVKDAYLDVTRYHRRLLERLAQR